MTFQQFIYMYAILGTLWRFLWRTSVVGFALTGVYFVIRGILE